MKSKKSRLKICIFLSIIIMCSYSYSNLRYSQRYNIIIDNRSDGFINKISFKPGRDSIENLDVTHVAPHEQIEISRQFNKAGENFFAIIDTPYEKDKVIPLAYIYSENSINIAKLIIEDTKDNKITKLTVLSFDNFPKIIPWWIRSFYDYEQVDYDNL